MFYLLLCLLHVHLLLRAFMEPFVQCCQVFCGFNIVLLCSGSSKFISNKEGIVAFAFS